MIRINLLGKKKVSNIPFGLGERLEKLGISGSDLAELRPAIAKIIFIIAGLYLGNFVPTYLHEQKIAALEARIAEMALREQMKAVPVEAQLMVRIGELNNENARLKAEVASRALPAKKAV